MKILLKSAGALFILFILLMIGLATYFDINHNRQFELPSPTGSFAVGRTSYDWVDSKKLDPLSTNPKENRELLVWVWYPANRSQDGLLAPYLPPVWVKARDQDQGVGKFIEHNFASIRTHSFENASLAQTPDVFPIIVMQPGMGPVPTDYTVFAENLASHGYIVLGINQTYTSNLIVFPDGRIVPRSEKGTIPDNADAVMADQDANRIENTWADDVVFVLGKLQDIQSDPKSIFHNRLDLAHIGVFGHSFGGATAVRICEKDIRCKAGADLDGTVFSEDLNSRIQAPFLFMAEDECGKDCDSMHRMYLGANSAAYYISVKGTKHFNFSDLPLRLLPPGHAFFRGMGIIGPIQPARGLEISNAYLVAFFDEYLKGVSAGLLQAPSSAFPEVKIERR